MLHLILLSSSSLTDVSKEGKDGPKWKCKYVFLISEEEICDRWVTQDGAVMHGLTLLRSLALVLLDDAAINQVTDWFLWKIALQLCDILSLLFVFWITSKFCYRHTRGCYSKRLKYQQPNIELSLLFEKQSVRQEQGEVLCWVKV